MEVQQLIKYFKGLTTESEERAVRQWLAADVDGSRADLYRKAHTIFAGMVVYDDDTIAGSGKSHVSASIMRPVFRFVAVAAVLLLCVFATVRLTRNSVMDSLAEVYETVSLPVGNSVKITLSDGTDMWIKGGSTVKYPSVFARKSRNVEVVAGEVCFDVESNPDKPFIVKTFASDVTVLGTRFNVKVDESGNIFSTSLLRGKVKVENKFSENESVVLAPNQMVEMVDNHLRVAQIEDAAIVDWWTTGIIDIAGVQFDTLMRRFAAIYGVDIEIRRKDLPQVGYTWGKVRVSDGLEHALSTIAKASDFQWRKDATTGKVVIE